MFLFEKKVKNLFIFNFIFYKMNCKRLIKEITMKLNPKDIQDMFEDDEVYNKRIMKQIGKLASRDRENQNILNSKRFDNNEYGTKSNIKKRPKF